MAGARPSAARHSKRVDPLDAAERVLSDVNGLRGSRLAAAVSGGVDSVVLLHVLRALSSKLGFELRAVTVHHGLSPNADAWSKFVRRLCRRWSVPLATRRVTVLKRGKGIEGAARDARYAALARLPVDAVALAHHLDDQAETVLLNLLRGAGVRGASGMRAVTQWGRSGGPRRLLRPFLAVAKEDLLTYAQTHRLQWVDDESNRDETFARNFVRLRVGPLLALRFPQWRESFARAAGHFADADRLLCAITREETSLTAARLREMDPAAARLRLREQLNAHGLRAPAARTLAEMLRQIATAAPDARVAIEHDGAVVRVYRGEVLITRGASPSFGPVSWQGEPRVPLPELGGELRFRRSRGNGIDVRRLNGRSITIRLRGGGERFRPDARRPRRTLKNLFQEAGIPSWERDRLPLLYSRGVLVWAPGLGVDAGYRVGSSGVGVLPEWIKSAPRAAPRRGRSARQGGRAAARQGIKCF